MFLYKGADSPDSTTAWKLLRPSDTSSKRRGKIDTSLKGTGSRRLAEKSRANDVRPYGMPELSFSS